MCVCMCVCRYCSIMNHENDVIPKTSHVIDALAASLPVEGAMCVCGYYGAVQGNPIMLL